MLLVALLTCCLVDSLTFFKKNRCKLDFNGFNRCEISHHKWCDGGMLYVFNSFYTISKL